MAPPVFPARVRPEDLPLSFGRYDLLEVLGEGGMGRVFGARLRGPSGFSRPVALKMLISEAAGGPNEKDLLNEARIGGLLRHPNIVAIHDCGMVGDHAFIVMEWVEHLTLAALLDERGSLPPSAVADLALQACAGLVYAHGLEVRGRKAGLIHRDLKPANLLVAHDGTVKLADLGLARTRLYSEEVSLSDGLRGTPPYMSPEQVMEAPLDHRSDQFSLGIILYEAATGRRLFQGGVLEILVRVRSPQKELNRPLHRNRLNRVEPRLREIILRCLKEAPEER
ncbi:MAG: serine/threonine-protein kinase, partial [Myxococcota bacterium]|nr:serine/threonine-protein kinase [Myxococcota bacterium]